MTQVNQTILICSISVSNYVAVRVQITAHADFNASQLVGAFESWPQTLSSVIVQGEILSVNSECPLVITSFDDSACSPASILSPPTMLHSNTTEQNIDDEWIVIISQYAAPAVILVIFVSFLLVCIQDL